MRLIVVVTALSFVGCITAAAEGEGEPPPPAPVVKFYTGTVTTSHPDTGVPFGPAEDTVTKRTVDAAARTIVEEVVSQGLPIVTTMTERGDTNVFDASDDGGTFSGTLTFDGSDFAFTGWTYFIELTDGSGVITGVATIDDENILTHKTYSDHSGTAQALIADALHVVDEDTYDAERATLVHR